MKCLFKDIVSNTSAYSCFQSLLWLCLTEKLNARYRSGATKIHSTRPLSSGQQTFDTNKSLWPLTQPLEKVEALVCTALLLFRCDNITLNINLTFLTTETMLWRNHIF
jgi:hypothetical protein